MIHRKQQGGIKMTTPPPSSRAVFVRIEPRRCRLSRCGLRNKKCTTWLSQIVGQAQGADRDPYQRRGQRAGPGRTIWAGPVNKNCTGLAQIVGQLEGFNRDFRSKCWAKSRNCQPCTSFVVQLTFDVGDDGLTWMRKGYI
jgi:hypothetical protein